ncbi:hypothetical protein HNP69_002809 [Chryseobacterium koreense]|nr:hypothetical protein [Chryseobacterium koreense]
MTKLSNKMKKTTGYDFVAAIFLREKTSQSNLGKIRDFACEF